MSDTVSALEQQRASLLQQISNCPICAPVQSPGPLVVAEVPPVTVIGRMTQATALTCV
jgi:hypothetical protein